MLTYLARRGLLFFDNGAATHSAAPDVATRAGVSFAQATATIDSIQTAMEIDHQLSELENSGARNGSASGSGFIYPVTIDRVCAVGAGPRRPGLCSGAGIGHSVVRRNKHRSFHAPSRRFPQARRSAVPPVRRHHAGQSRRAGIRRPPHRPDDRRLADAAGRHRRRRNAAAGRACANSKEEVGTDKADVPRARWTNG